MRHSRVRGRRGARALGGLVTAVTLGAWLVLTAVPAFAAVTCTFGSTPAGSTVTLTSDAAETFAVGRNAAGLIQVDPDGLDSAVSGYAVLTGACAGASVNNVVLIAIASTAAANAQEAQLDLANGGFVSTAGNEVDISVSLDAGTDILHIEGSAGADNVRYGVSGINLTGDDDADVTFAADVEDFTADGNAGDDVISGAGGLGTGSTFASDLTVFGDDGTFAATGGNDTLTGGSGDDDLEGEGGADTIDGGAGDDFVGGDDGDDPVLNGGSGDDHVHGGDGNDVIDAGPGDDTSDTSGDAGNDIVRGGPGDDLNVEGDAGNDIVDGGTGNDTEFGGSGDDTFDQGATANGADDMTGGTGTDTVSYAARTAAVNIDDDGVASDDDGEADEDDGVAADVEVLVGGSAADTIEVTDGTVVGGPGGDTLSSLGIDTLSYAGSTAGVSVDLATDSDATTAGVQPTVSGGDATGDVVSAGFENVTGSDSTDTLIGDAVDNVLTGGKGDDAITGAAGDDDLFGGDGNDTYNEGTASSGSDLIGDDPGTATNEDAGSDTVNYSGRTTAVVVTTKAGGFDDGEDSNGDGVADEDDDVETENVWGGSAADTITGDAGANTIAGNAGADTLDGAAGTDTADYSADTAGVTVNLSTSTAAGGDAEGDTVANFENATGGAGNDSLTGSNGENTLTGGAGNDKLAGRGDDDTLAGGDGKDTVNYSGSASGVVVNLKTGVGAGITEGTDTLVGIENATGTLFRDTLTGNNAANILRGGDGRDTLKGLNGKDRLLGGAGRDTGDGGKGIDTCRSIEREKSCEK